MLPATLSDLSKNPPLLKTPMKKSDPGLVDEHGNALDAKYDPAQFHVSPTDAKGVSYRLTFRVPPDMEKGIDQVLASKRFPFTTRGDVLRWGTQQALKLLEKMEPVVSVSKKVEILSTMLQEEASHSEFMATFNHLQEAVERYMGDSAPEQATRVVAMAKHQFESMPPGYWRDRYLEELNKRFGHLITKAGISLAGT